MCRSHFLETSQHTNNTNITSKNTYDTNYDTSKSKTSKIHARLYKVGSTYYYRRRINKKLYRLSLRTTSFFIALKRRKLLNFIRGEDLYKLKHKDIEIIFEYDTVEEYEKYMELSGANDLLRQFDK